MTDEELLAALEAPIETEFTRAIDAAIAKNQYALASRIALEGLIVRRLVLKGIEEGFSFSVYDGEETTVNKSRHYSNIMQALHATDEDTLKLFDAKGIASGWFHLVYGNEGYDVISDYLANNICTNLYNHATNEKELALTIKNLSN